MLDIGANRGYFCDKATSQYGAVCVAVDRNPVVLEANCLCVITELNAAKLVELAKSDNFDVVLCMSVLHHIPLWRSFYEALLLLGDHIVLEMPTPQEQGYSNRSNAVSQYYSLTCSPHELLGLCKGYKGEDNDRAMLLFKGIKHNVVSGGFCDWKRACTPRKVISNFDAKYIVKGGERIPWLPGINLWSFLQLGGQKPTREAIADMLEVPDGSHGDVRPWNYVLGNDTCKLIDSGYIRYNDATAFMRTKELILNAQLVVGEDRS